MRKGDPLEEMELTFHRPDDAAKLSVDDRVRLVHENKDLCAIEGNDFSSAHSYGPTWPSAKPASQNAPWWGRKAWHGGAAVAHAASCILALHDLYFKYRSKKVAVRPFANAAASAL